MTLTVFTILRNSMHEKYKIRSVEAVSEVSPKSKVKIVTYVKRQRDQKVKRNLKNIGGWLSPEIPSRELNEKLRSTLSEQQIN